eukprot:COSAG02_NODE_5290_length_4467_cov_1646.171206_4_plen_43_part_00
MGYNSTALEYQQHPNSLEAVNVRFARERKRYALPTWPQALVS